ncbi:MAG: M14 family zinc carboxypeptidase, partial [Prolixibacteraceae bacterium]|nr:M14 family zinc carboxypeptidase [Prolixibacteraceae bacterium]
MQKECKFHLTWLLAFIINTVIAQNPVTFDKYHNTGEVRQIIENIHQANPGITKLHTIAVSPGGEPVMVLEISNSKETCPAVFTGANFEGNYPVAAEGALMLIKMLLDSSQYLSGLKWYIMPMPNPDAAKGFFSKVKYNRTVNDFPINNDVDENIDEDGYDDLNGDGYITQMRVKSLDGTHIPYEKDPRLMIMADARKSERGIYKIYTEGTDNDIDGEYNEDSEGGINPGIAFPHLFPANTKEAGLYSGQTPEVYGILKFIFDHPEIAMVFTLGSSDFCLNPPESGRKGDPQTDKIK